MVAKKRTQLRSKAAKQTKAEKEEQEVLTEFPPDEKAFLHQPRESKKAKSLIKSQNFVSRIKEQNNPSGVSKSSLRRRKRKLRDELKPKMNDLLQTLQQEGVLDEDVRDNLQSETEVKKSERVTKVTKSDRYNFVSSSETGKVSVKRNEPNIRNQKGAKQLAQQETKRFNEVLLNQTFQHSPFDALREAIKMREQ